jgi:hypothetical protein
LNRYNNPLPFQVLEQISSSLSDHISSTRDMSISSESSVLQSLVEGAAEKYQKQVGISLIENQLVAQLQRCDSADSVAAVLEEGAQAFLEHLGRDRYRELIKSISLVVHTLHSIFATLGGAVQIGQGIGSLVRPNALMISILLIPDAYSVVPPTCETNIFCHRYPPCCMFPLERMFFYRDAY